MDTNTLLEDQAKVSPEFRSGFVALVGPTNAGKSALLNRLVGAKVSIVSPRQQSTRTRVLGICNRPAAQIVLLDTPGLVARRYRGELARRLRRSIVEAVSDVDMSVLVVDAQKSIEDYGEILRVQASFHKRRLEIPSVVALNKIDRVEKGQLLPLLSYLADVLGEFHPPGSQNPLELVPVSALNGEGIDVLEGVVLKRLAFGPPCYPQDMRTDQAEEFFVAEVIREKAFLLLHDELPYSIAVRVEKWEERPNCLAIYALILVERESQKAIVIGRGGKKLGAIGRIARAELERIFKLPVYLELVVRVEEQWTRTAAGLNLAGLGEA